MTTVTLTLSLDERVAEALAATDHRTVARAVEHAVMRAGILDYLAERDRQAGVLAEQDEAEKRVLAEGGAS